MSTTEGFEGQNKGAPADTAGADMTGAACGARDLKGLLNRIADQIADADRRHSAALDTMHDRLGDLVRGTVSVRDQIAAGNPVASESPEAMRDGAAVQKSAGIDESRSVHGISPSEAGLADAAPAALRSALGSGADGRFTRKDESGQEVDPFDVVGFEDRAHDDEPWDHISAEALTRIYEVEGLVARSRDEIDAPVPPVETGPATGAEDPKVSTPDDMPASVPAAAAGLSLAAAAAAVSVLPGLPALPGLPVQSGRDDIERAWLEAKFADIATMLEQSLEALKPDGSMVALEERFERLEVKLGDALSDAATRSDLAGLKSIEMQVEDLALQLESVQTQISRLSDIEAELRALGQHVSEERMTKLMANATPAAAAVPDDLAQRVAQQVAKQVIDGMPREATRGDDGKRFDELRSLVNGFIAEQRQGDEQTVTMLDTMQQAMIRLLDRMDAVESGAVTPDYPSYDAQDDGSAAGYGREAGSGYRGHDIDDHVEPQKQEAHEIEMMPAPSAGVRQKVEASALDAAAPVVESMRPEVKRPSPSAAERTTNAKEDFIASARRAAKQAAEAKAEEDAAEQTAAKPTGRLASAAAAITGGKKTAAAASAGGAKRGTSKLMLGVLVLFALAGSFTIVNAVMKMNKPPVERRINVTPPNIMERDDTGAPGTIIDREGEPANSESDSGDRSGPAPEPGQRSGETMPRSIAPDFDTQRKVAGTSGHIVDESGTPVGIVLQRSAAITRPEHVVRLKEQQTDAALSARLGAAQVPAPAVPAAMIPDSSVLGTTVLPVTRQHGTGVSARTVNELPPAHIGPNSLRQAAAKGDPSAEFEVGARFAEGKGLQQDLKLAVTWYQRSASQGFAQAQYRLATMYERGLGVKADLERAKVWYQRAADQGTAKAMHNLAVLSTGREGVPADYVTSAQWFSKAAAYGLVDSQFNLAVLYDSGLGVEKDVKQAYKWYALAAKSGDEEAARRHEALRGKLATAELVQVTAEIDGWRPMKADSVVNDPRVAGERWKLNGTVSAN